MQRSTLNTLIVLWPAALWCFGLCLSLAIRLYGCTISARGPEACIVAGYDIGVFVYPLFGLGFYLIYVFLWMPVGLIIVFLLRVLFPNKDRF